LVFISQKDLAVGELVCFYMIPAGISISLEESILPKRPKAKTQTKGWSLLAGGFA